MPVEQVLLPARAFAEPVPQTAVTVSFCAALVPQTRVQVSLGFPVSLAMAEGSSRALELQAVVSAFHVVFRELFAQVVQQTRAQVSLVLPVSLAMAEGSSQALELEAVVPAFHVVSRELFAQVVPSPPVPIPRQVAQVLMVAPVVLLPVAPVSFPASRAPQCFGPFANENREYLY